MRTLSATMRSSKHQSSSRPCASLHRIHDARSLTGTSAAYTGVVRALGLVALVVGMLVAAASSARAQVIELRFDVTRGDLYDGLEFPVYLPPGHDTPITENGEQFQEIFWLQENGLHDSRLTVNVDFRSLRGSPLRGYGFEVFCPECQTGEVLIYRYLTGGPTGNVTGDYELIMTVVSKPLGAPCTVGKECVNEACIDGVCCNWECGANMGWPFMGSFPAAPCMACSAANGATADGVCTLLSTSPRCDNGTCTPDPVVGNQAPASTCVCESGWSGRGCDADVNECDASNGGCDPLSSCTNEMGAPPVCGGCPSGYAGTGMTGCTDIDECLADNGGCDVLTTCNNQTGAPRTCSACPMGYAGTGATGCTDIDECMTDNGGCDALSTCVNMIGGPVGCGGCPSGYTGTGAGGCVDIDECATANGGCDALTVCTNQAGAFPTCSACPTGYDGMGASGCTDIDECATNNGDCDALTSCSNNVGAPPTCGACPTGYTGTGATDCVSMSEDAGVPADAGDAGVPADAGDASVTADAGDAGPAGPRSEGGCTTSPAPSATPAWCLALIIGLYALQRRAPAKPAR